MISHGESLTAYNDFTSIFATCPLMVSLRGIRPDEIEAVGGALFAAGIRLFEVPLTSPEPFESITRLSALAGPEALVGGGAVLDVEAVGRIGAAGGRLVTSPCTDREVIAATVAAGMVAIPGFFTPTEAFCAMNAGAHALKFFPAEAGSPSVLKALRAVLPRAMPVLAMGGMTPDGLAAWRAGGADGFGLGISVFTPGMTAEAAGEAAARFVGAAGPEDRIA